MIRLITNVLAMALAVLLVPGILILALGLYVVDAISGGKP